MPRVTEPDVAIIRPAYNVVLVSWSIFVLGMGTLVYVRCAVMPASVMTSGVMATPVMPATMVAASVAPSMTTAFRIRRCYDSNSERGSERKDERNLLQHFCFSSLAREIVSSIVAIGS